MPKDVSNKKKKYTTHQREQRAQAMAMRRKMKMEEKAKEIGIRDNNEATPSKTSLKTGQKKGKSSRAKIEARKEERMGEIVEAKKMAEKDLMTYPINAIPAELLQCDRTRVTMLKRLVKYDLDESQYKREIAKIHIPCPLIAFDSNQESRFPFEVTQYKILCGIEPEFLVRKFKNVLSPRMRHELQKRWKNFMDEDPIAYITEKHATT